MEGLGEGYEAFVERLQSEFPAANVSKGAGQNVGANANANANTLGGSSTRQGGFPSHPPHVPLHQTKYVGYPSLANAFTVKKEESSFPMESSMRGRHAFVDMPKEDVATSSGLMHVPPNHSSALSKSSDMPFRQRGHRRAQSEIAFRLPDDIIFDDEPGLLDSITADTLGDRLYELQLNANAIAPSVSMAMPGMQPVIETSRPPATYSHHARSLSVDHLLAGFNTNEDAFGLIDEAPVERGKPRHSHSHSMDGYTDSQKELSASNTSKAISDSKLAELALVDPKRAKRILANRQSAARSKERKMRYIAELEGKVQALQTQARALSARLTIMQDDTTALTKENNDLKFQLQTLEQQTQQSDDLNVILKEQLQKLKIATGEVGARNMHLMGLEHHPGSLSKQFY